MTENTVDIFYRSSAFLTNISYKELDRVGKYIAFMEGQNKKPKRAHISNVLAAEIYVQFGIKAEIEYKGVKLIPTEPDKLPAQINKVKDFRKKSGAGLVYKGKIR